MAQTLEQKIAEAQARLARLKNQTRALETGQKVIVGAIALQGARDNPGMRTWLLGRLRELKRPADQQRVASLIAELDALPASQNQEV